MRFWRDGGSTDPANTVLLCTRHHTLLHQHGYQLVQDPDNWGGETMDLGYVVNVMMKHAAYALRSGIFGNGLAARYTTFRRMRWTTTSG